MKRIFEGGITFWFELAPEGYSYGLGYWDMPALTAAKFRARLDRDPKPFEKLARSLKKRPDLLLKGPCFSLPFFPQLWLLCVIAPGLALEKTAKKSPAVWRVI